MNRSADFHLPGAVFAGMCSNSRVNGGQSVPLFEPKGRTDGKPSINTREGWNALCREGNRHSFILANGREPANDAEVDAWVNRITGRAQA